MQERLLGGLTAREFLRRHWQKKPLLVRRAFEERRGLIGKRALFSLAARADVESRLVLRRGTRWRLERGPLPGDRLARLPARSWTLLVNGVNLHAAGAERLLRRFAFLPQARLDDVMVSYAAPGGGVGPHTDSYDVFLVQGAGRRLWRLERKRRFALVPDAPLPLLADFRPDDEYLLEPGDLLYLPPGWGHDGIALGECWTYSVGLRAPRGAELAAAFVDYLHERGLPDAEFRDPGLRPASRPARIPPAMVGFAAAVLDRIAWTRRDALALLGRHLTAPKPHVVFSAPRRALGRLAFARRLRQADAVLDPKSQLLYRGRAFFLNGEPLTAGAGGRAALARLADRRRVAGAALARSGLSSLAWDWYRSGQLHLERAE